MRATLARLCRILTRADAAKSAASAGAEPVLPPDAVDVPTQASP
jgi:hypothetical protein